MSMILPTLQCMVHSFHCSSMEMLDAVVQSCILADGFRSLAEGEDVEFEITEDQTGRLRAVNVSGPGGAQPKVCNLRRS